MEIAHFSGIVNVIDMKYLLLTLFLGFFILNGKTQVTLLSESFETDGEGSRYFSTTFDLPSPTCDFFARMPASPLNPCFQNNLFSNFQGNFFWGSEDIMRAGTNLPPGYIVSQNINTSGYNNLSISLYLATSNNVIPINTRWERADSINIQVSFNGGTTYTTVGRFMGNAEFGGDLIHDLNLNGIADPGEPVASLNTFTKYTFNITGTGSSMIYKLDFDQIGGSEELGIDLIEVKGTAAPTACPNTNPNFFCSSYDASGLTLNSRMFICDLLAGEYQDLVLTGGNTYRVDFCGFSGGTPAPPYNSLITVYNQTNNSLVGFNDDFCGDDPQFDFVAPVTGTYRVLANISGNCGGTNGFILTPLGLTLLNVASAPEINVQGNAMTINDGDNMPASNDNTSFGSVPACNGTITKTFVIQNTGNSNLTVSSVTFNGGQASDFSLTSGPAGTVTPGNSTSFQVTFNPSAIGLRSTTLQIANNDANENPYDFVIEGTGSASPLAANISNTSPVACFGQSTGSITVTAGNGTANYNYVWSNGAMINNTPSNTNTINMLPSGTYFVTVTDVNGCSATASGNVSQPGLPLTLSSVNTPAVCINGNNASINLTASGGTPGYTYLWSNAALTQDLVNLVSGTYTVTVTDASGCTSTLSASVSAPNFTISGNSIPISRGDLMPSVADGTDFGVQNINSSTPQTFDLTNNAIAISIDSVTSSASEFVLSSVPSNLAQSGTEDFVVTYNPTSGGVHNGVIRVYYNGCTATPYDFAVTGQTCAGNQFTFIGPGTDPQQPSNWLNGCVPPMNNTSTIVIIQPGTTLVLSGPFTGNIINNGTLRGSLQLNGTLTNNGVLRPGN